MGVVVDFQAEAARVRAQRQARVDLIAGPIGLFDLACWQAGLVFGAFVSAWVAPWRRG